MFAGKNMVQSQRMVYGAIADLMKGDRAAGACRRQFEDPDALSNAGLENGMNDFSRSSALICLS